MDLLMKRTCIAMTELIKSIRASMESTRGINL